jgi:hypothetical protein
MRLTETLLCTVLLLIPLVGVMTCTFCKYLSLTCTCTSKLASYVAQLHHISLH